MAEVRVKGLSEIAKFLEQVPTKLARNTLRAGMRQGGNVIRDAARQNAPVKLGALKKSIKVGTRSRGGTVTATVRASVFYASFVEFGTKAHSIKPKNRKAVAFGDMVFRAVQHAGARPKPYMRPALDSRAGAAVVAVAERMRMLLQTKAGLDVGDIEIGEV